MLKTFGLTLTLVFLLGFTACTSQSEKNTNTARTASAEKAATATPTPTPTPSAPMTASVKAVGLKWQDDASGTPVTTIKVGGTVTWTISAGVPHSLQKVAGTADNGCDQLDDSFDSDLDPDQPVSRTFTKVGTFGYHCGIHLGNPNCKTPPGTGRMPGIIKVVP